MQEEVPFINFLSFSLLTRITAIKRLENFDVLVVVAIQLTNDIYEK